MLAILPDQVGFALDLLTIAPSVTVIAVIAAALAVAVVARATSTTHLTRSPLCNVATVRDQQERTAFLPLRDPNDASRPRPRAPSPQPWAA